MTKRTVTTDCRIPGCTEANHIDDLCNVFVESAGPGITLMAEVEAWEGKTPELIVWETEDSRNLFRTYDRSEATAYADKLRALATTVDRYAALLAAPAEPVEPVDYAARFAALDSDVLFDLEDQGDCDTAARYVESLLIVLGEWRTRVQAMLAEAPEWAVPEAAEYRRALDRTREAWAQYSFRWVDGPALPYPFDLDQPKAPEIRPTAAARIVRAGHRDLIVRGAAA